ncbi:MAG TPA: phage antirepressor N-terminal domain-containing protein [Urbifossiella sp.]|nr:phage antirepressor N-terminal domain-containing protein [Urbifossiella sp.]
MSGQLIRVEFHGDTLEAVEQDGKVWVSLRRCCENLGLAMEGQLAKLKGKGWAVMTEIFMTGPDGKRYEMAAVDLDTLPGWLFSIDARKVREEIREKLAHYQREAAHHFFR